MYQLRQTLDPGEMGRAHLAPPPVSLRTVLASLLELTATASSGRGAGIDRVKLARYLPSLLDTPDELKAVAAKLGAAAGDVHLGSDASETVVKRATLNDYRVVYSTTMVSSPAMSRDSPKRRSP